MRSNRTILILVLVLVPSAVVVTQFLGRETPARGPVVVPTSVAEEEQAAPTSDLAAPTVVAAPRESLETTVLHPLRFELEWVAPSEQELPKDMIRIGSGASARLTVTVLKDDVRGAPAELEFVAGANVGRPPLKTDAAGRMRADDLYPGLSIVEVRGAGLVGSRREVRLRQNKEASFVLHYGRLVPTVGRVVDPQGEPLDGATVFVDGQRTYSTPDGTFFLSGVAAGQVLVEIEKDGFAAYQELVHLSAERPPKPDQLVFRLQRSCALKIAVPDRVGGPGPIQIVLVAGLAQRRTAGDLHYRNGRFPWHRVNPTEINPNSTRTIEGLPQGVVRIHAFRAGTRPREDVVTLRPGETETHVLRLLPAPKISGRVLADGEPVAGATVRLEAPNRVQATLGYLKMHSLFLETQVLPHLPPALQEARTTGDGRFAFTRWDDLAPRRYLWAESADGAWYGTQIVERGTEHVELLLEPARQADSSLLVDFGERWQALPVEVIVDGEPRPVELVPPGRKHSIEKIVPGVWRWRAAWNGKPVGTGQELSVQGVASVSMALPPGAIDGQDRAAWEASGRPYPF